MRQTRDPRRLHKRVYNGGSQTRGAHRRRERDQHVHPLVQLRVDAQRGECLRGALAKPDITNATHTGASEDIFNRVGNVMPSKLV